MQMIQMKLMQMMIRGAVAANPVLLLRIAEWVVTSMLEVRTNNAGFVHE